VLALAAAGHRRHPRLAAVGIAARRLRRDTCMRSARQHSDRNRKAPRARQVSTIFSERSRHWSYEKGKNQDWDGRGNDGRCGSKIGSGQRSVSLSMSPPTQPSNCITSLPVRSTLKK
jgi:hypothetical protein